MVQPGDARGDGRRQRGLVATFHGVRGSTPCCSASLQRYGGNTSCVVVDGEDEPIVLDLGTGLRQWGCELGLTSNLTVHALVSHLHWDHVQGLPFFAPLHRDDTSMIVYGPPGRGETLASSFGRLMRPPFFPITPEQLMGRVEFVDVHDESFVIGDTKITTADVPHTDTTNGYRLERGGVSLAYVSDHQEPASRDGSISDSVLGLCAGVDLLIHDAQFTAAEFERRPDWGHCTVDYAVEVARRARAGALALFHHDPGHDDEEIDRLEAAAVAQGAAAGIRHVFAAAEGMTVEVGSGTA